MCFGIAYRWPLSWYFKLLDLAGRLQFDAAVELDPIWTMTVSVLTRFRSRWNLPRRSSRIFNGTSSAADMIVVNSDFWIFPNQTFQSSCYPTFQQILQVYTYEGNPNLSISTQNKLWFFRLSISKGDMHSIFHCLQACGIVIFFFFEPCFSRVTIVCSVPIA